MSDYINQLHSSFYTLLEQGEQRPAKLFSTAYHNCHIRRLQAKAQNPHAVFLVSESEAITYHYELDLRQGTLHPDPRIAHTLNLKFDEYANVLQSVAVVYPRVGQFEDNTLKADELTLIRNVQRERHLAYTETRYTNDFGKEEDQNQDQDQDNHRLRVPCEVLTYELTVPDSRDNRYFTLEELRRLRLSEVYEPSAKPPEIISVEGISYQSIPNRTTYQKRLVEHVRMLFFKDDSAAPDEPLPLGLLGRLGLPYETYKLALTEDLLGAVFGAKLTPEVRDKLSDAKVSGYLSGAPLATRFPGIEAAGQYWIRSGIAGFAPDAAQHFYLPERYEDPFGNVTTLEYDPRDLFVKSSTDAMQNKTEVTLFDFRVLAPREMKDINDNLSEVFFDVLGLPTAMAVKGKGSEGDSLTGLTDALANPGLAELTAFFNEPNLDEARARAWLGNGTARHVYYFGEIIEDGRIIWGTHPACACGILRERHVSQLAPGEKSRLQSAFEYSDGLGSVIVKKVQAEPERDGGPLRWVANGKTILNNKGKPVKQYEPYFSPPEMGHRFEEPREEGVTPVIYYDAVGRTVCTEMPDGSFSRVEFSPWHVCTFDQNDTVKEAGNAWFARKSAGMPEEQRAAQLATEHAGTPALTILDSLGREVVSIAHNRVRNDAGELKDEKYLTFTKLDAEGKPLWIRDARKNLVMQYITPPAPNNQAADPVIGFVPCYDIAGNLLYQHSMDAGDRWMLNDAAGKPMFAWDSRGHIFRTEYDKLHRPVGSFVTGAVPQNPNREIQFEKIIYGDTLGNGLTVDPKQLNLRGKPYKHHDTAGVVTSMGRNPVTGGDEAFDFKGNLLRSTRQLVKDYKGTPDWSRNPVLETEIFTSSTRYDALNRPIQLIAPHNNQSGTKLNIIRPGFNEAGLLEHMDVWLEQQGEPQTLLDTDTATRHIVTNIDYNAKGQRELIAYGNGVITEYEYDEFTFRLNHLQTQRGGEALQNLLYTYDPVGNITQIRDEAQDTVFHRNNCVKPGAEYRYDALYRLIAASGREHRGGDQQTDWDNSMPIVPAIANDCQALRNYVETYCYDAVGNILKMLHQQGRDLDQPGQPVWKRCYQYAVDSNRLLATHLPGEPDDLEDYTATPSYGAKYSYDAHGNITSMLHLPAMEWDFKDQLRSSQRQVVNDGIGEKTWYVYDAGGQRVRKVTETQNGKPKDERIYLGGFEVYRKYNGNGQAVAVTLERETLHVMDDKQRVALIETRTRGDDPTPPQLMRYQLSNHLDSSVLEMTDQAQVISYEEYHPYGTTAYQAARNNIDTPKRYRYTGKERDEETGFGYHGARYYVGWLGRWSSCDPAGMVDGPNIYAYGHCNPIRNSDQSGTQCIDILGWGTAGGDDALIHQCPSDPYEGGSVPRASLTGPSSVKSNATQSQAPSTKPGPKPTAKQAPPQQKMSDAESMQNLKAVTEQLQLKLTYPKPVRQAMGVGQLVSGSLEAGAGLVASEFGVGAFLYLHGIDNASSGLVTALTGEASPTYTFQLGSGAAKAAGADPKLADAVGQSTELTANIAAGALSLRLAAEPITPRAPKVPSVRPGALSKNPNNLPSPKALDPSFPDFNPGGFCENCAEVAVKVDRWLGGSKDITPAGNSSRPLFEEVEEQFGNKFFESTGTEVIEALQETGPGSRGLIHVESGEKAHLVNVVNWRGNIIAIDAQNMTYGSLTQVLKNSGYSIRSPIYFIRTHIP